MINKIKNKKGSDLYHTPPRIFEAMPGVSFDLDVAAPISPDYYHVPAKDKFTSRAQDRKWFGYVWMNCPFSQKGDFIHKFFEHGNGVALLPNSTAAAWFHDCLNKADGMLIIKKRVSFIRPCGEVVGSPPFGSILFASGPTAIFDLKRAEFNGLGYFLEF